LYRVRHLHVLLIAILFGSLLAICVAAQDPPPPTETPSPDSFFSGTVLEFKPDKITVSRAILGKPAETRSFSINADTKVEGRLKNRSRVTVRFTSGEEGDIAVSIIVRAEKDRDRDKKK
jgi:hypothetical protein